jgi:hypothetical protein
MMMMMVMMMTTLITITCFSYLCQIVCNNTLAHFLDRNRETYHQNLACISLVSYAGHMPSTLQVPRFYFLNPFDIFVFEVRNLVIRNIVY